MSVGRPSYLSVIKERFSGRQWFALSCRVFNTPAEIRCYHRTSYILCLASDEENCKLNET